MLFITYITLEKSDDCINLSLIYIYANNYVIFSGLFHLQMTESKHKVTKIEKKFVASLN